MPISVAIIGSGPAGFYTADALLKSCDACEIDIIERLPTPYGLIRGGVAPDHQTTKRVARKYEKTAMVEEVNFYGNVTVNGDVSLAELREIYDAVVLAVGAPGDRKLTIPGAEKYGVFGSAAFVGWYNGHPDFHELNPDLNVEAAVVIGNGNVAVDCARVLLRTPRGMAMSDLPDHVKEAIHSAPITDVYMVGRRGPIDAKFTNVELREMGALNQTVPQMKAEQMPEDLEAALAELEGRERRLKERNLNTLQEFTTRVADEKPKRVHFEFFAQPVEILGGERVEGIRMERTRVVDGRAEGTGETFDIPCGLVIPAIGYRADAMEGAPYDESRGIIPNNDGRVDDGLYAVGWIKRGPTGVISSNRPDGEIVAQHIRDDFGGAGGKPGRGGFEKLLAERGTRWVSFDEWKRIDEMEVANAEGDAPRRKFVTVQEMLDALDADKPEAARG